MLSGSSVYVVSAVPRRSVIPSGLSSLGRQSIPSSLQAYFSLSSLGSSLRVSLTSVVSADRRVRLEAHSNFSPQYSRPTIDLGCTGDRVVPFRLLGDSPTCHYAYNYKGVPIRLREVPYTAHCLISACRRNGTKPWRQHHYPFSRLLCTEQCGQACNQFLYS